MTSSRAIGHNTGYKNYDPSHPCSRCWEKHSKIYSGAITYAPWRTADGTTPSAASNFQRPLPNFRAPQASLHHQSTSWTGPSSSSGLSRAATTSRASGYPGASGRVIPIAGGALPMSPYLDVAVHGPGSRAPQPQQQSQWPPTHWGQVQGGSGGGGVAVLRPGDARIGGRLCWRCGGSGTTSFLIFDEQTCSICNGIGRTFV